jgi:NAD(P)-dependent dehydrogenase (short-subunit alcohol dehydrogenase family)
VTGGGRGIGLKLAEALGAEGYSIIIADLSDAEEAASRLRATGVSCYGVKADVSVEADVSAMASAAMDHFGGIDALVNNAGLFTTLRSFEEISADEWMKVMRVNTLGPFLCAKAAVPSKREGRGTDRQHRLDRGNEGSARLAALCRQQGSRDRPHPGVGPRSRTIRNNG